MAASTSLASHPCSKLHRPAPFPPRVTRCHAVDFVQPAAQMKWAMGNIGMSGTTHCHAPLCDMCFKQGTLYRSERGSDVEAPPVSVRLSQPYPIRASLGRFTGRAADPDGGISRATCCCLKYAFNAADTFNSSNGSVFPVHAILHHNLTWPVAPCTEDVHHEFCRLCDHSHRAASSPLSDSLWRW